MNTINFLVQAKQSVIQLYNSDLFFGMKIILAIYIAVLVADIILIIIIHTPGMYFRVLQAGANIPIARKDETQKRWEKVRNRIRGGNMSQYKAAVLEADELTNEILTKIGYAGENMGERLGNITLEQLEMIEELKEAHKVRNEIVRKADFSLDQKKAEELVSVYQRALETVDFL